MSKKNKPVPTSPKVKAEKELEKLYSDKTSFERPARSRIDWITSVIVGLLGGVIGGGLLLIFSDQLGLAQYLPSITSEREVVIRETEEVTSEQVQMDQALDVVSSALVSIYPKELAGAAELSSVLTPFDHLGTGVVLTADGLIVTSTDVIALPELSYVAVFANGEIYDITDIQADAADNLVLGRVDAKDLTVATFAKRGDVKVGDSVFMVELPPTSSSYHVRSASVSDWSYRLIATDEDVVLSSDALARRIRVNHAFAQGDERSVALLPDGKVLGFVEQAGESGTSAAVHVPYRMESLVRDFVENDEIVRPSLGAYYYDLSDTIGLSEDVTDGRSKGAVLLLDLSLDTSPAATSGLRDRDIVLSVNGDDITERESLSEAVLKHNPGDTVPVVVLRDGEEKTVDVKLD